MKSSSPTGPHAPISYDSVLHQYYVEQSVTDARCCLLRLAPHATHSASIDQKLCGLLMFAHCTKDLYKLDLKLCQIFPFLSDTF